MLRIDDSSIVLLLGPQRRTDEHDNVSPHKQHGDLSRLLLDNLFVGFFVEFGGGDGLFDVSEDHIQVLIEGLLGCLNSSRSELGMSE